MSSTSDRRPQEHVELDREPQRHKRRDPADDHDRVATYVAHPRHHVREHDHRPLKAMIASRKMTTTDTTSANEKPAFAASATSHRVKSPDRTGNCHGSLGDGHALTANPTRLH